ncbi:hypothetical protein E2562_037520, partial [Oryza meyeriana var. granulata]
MSLGHLPRAHTSLLTSPPHSEAQAARRRRLPPRNKPLPTHGSSAIFSHPRNPGSNPSRTRRGARKDPTFRLSPLSVSHLNGRLARTDGRLPGLWRGDAGRLHLRPKRAQ